MDEDLILVDFHKKEDGVDFYYWIISYKIY